MTKITKGWCWYCSSSTDWWWRINKLRKKKNNNNNNDIYKYAYVYNDLYCYVLLLHDDDSFDSREKQSESLLHSVRYSSFDWKNKEIFPKTTTTTLHHLPSLRRNEQIQQQQQQQQQQHKNNVYNSKRDCISINDGAVLITNTILIKIIVKK